MPQGLVISDLHLFSRRSRAEELLTEMAGVVTEAGILVLNGDVFDFRWSTLPGREATIAAALMWLDGLLSRRGERPTHYLLGNHDCVTGFTERLDGIAALRPSFRWHRTHTLIGRNLFLHGDCANRSMDAAALGRFRGAWSRDRQRGPLGRALYDGADRLGASRLVHDMWFPRRITVRRVAHHLDHVLPDWKQRVDHCFFGHTHLPFADHRHEGVLFHNTGSAIRGMEFRPLAFTCGEGAATS
jgi:UDP-2,3-diacylglucosamine hydrolase